jgi:hypothetical protein
MVGLRRFQLYIRPTVELLRFWWTYLQARILLSKRGIAEGSGHAIAVKMDAIGDFFLAVKICQLIAYRFRFLSLACASEVGAFALATGFFTDIQFREYVLEHMAVPFDKDKAPKATGVSGEDLKDLHAKIGSALDVP